MECFYCHQKYETPRELSIQFYIHSSHDEQPFPVFELHVLPQKKNSILEDFRSMNGGFDFPIVKPSKCEIPATEVSKTNSSKVQKGSLNASRCDTDEVRYSSRRDSGNYSGESTGFE
ncbi:hypothetical protein NPIL_390071 [Nephila pilipes]|uniref:C2H2-type domain-containing protein n=1 Tax=Nephila pilipes TaxID=299642 RepID=A0A8X6UK67_NEPPI|nr:hypothetical protein NPIL_390071 [Nephila pilipes]